MEENPFDCVSRPKFFGQCLQRNHPSGQQKTLLLQGKLLHVQENVCAEATRAKQRVREARKTHQGAESPWSIQESRREEAKGQFNEENREKSQVTEAR